MFRLQSEQVDANPNSFGFQYGSLEYQNLQCENSIHVNRKHYVTQNNQESTMHYTLKDHQGSPRAFTSSASPMQKGASA
jgi:hypothetical protein